MLGTDDSRPADEILSNTSSPCGSDSPTCFIRQSTFKTKEPLTQYPCLGKIYLLDNNLILFEFYTLNNHIFVLKCSIFRSISRSAIFKSRKFARTRFSDKLTSDCCYDSSVHVQQTFNSIIITKSFYDFSAMYTFSVSSKHLNPTNTVDMISLLVDN